MSNEWVFAATTAISVAAALALAILDRFTKIFVINHPAGGVIIRGWLQVRGASNAKLAFSLPFPNAYLPAVSAAAIFIFTWWWVSACRHREGLSAAALTLIVVGASSNLLDRLRWGHVVDYIDVPWFTVFNLADVMISVGVGMLVVQELNRWRHKRSDVIVPRSPF